MVVTLQFPKEMRVVLVNIAVIIIFAIFIILVCLGVFFLINIKRILSIFRLGNQIEEDLLLEYEKVQELSQILSGLVQQLTAYIARLEQEGHTNLDNIRHLSQSLQRRVDLSISILPPDSVRSRRGTAVPHQK